MTLKNIGIDFIDKLAKAFNKRVEINLNRELINEVKVNSCIFLIYDGIIGS